MDGGCSDGEKKPPEGGTSGEPKTKRKMKTAAQLEALEKTYQVETYPSEALRAELSTQLELTDRQLQMWFCHRRLKDKKGVPLGSVKKSKKGEASPVLAAETLLPPPHTVTAKDEMLGVEFGNEHGSGSGSGSSPYGHGDTRRGYVSRPGVAVPRLSGPVRYEPQQSVAELQAIAFVEAQLGEPLREDGPALGMEFDPLPPGAFGAPIASGASQQLGRGYDSTLYERADTRTAEVSGRALHEYQFLPEQPSVRSESYERLPQSHYYGSPSDGPGTRTPPLASGRSYMHSYEEAPVAYGLQGQISSLGSTSQSGKLHSTSGDYDSMARKSPYVGMESPFSAHPITGLDNPLIPADRHATQEDEIVRLERKRKSDEARIAKEVEAHEKKLRKELEKQDILRRKREEQMRKEMERQDRERRKEEERLLREKQREEERYQKEQKRELERREKYMLKESIRIEKQRQKEVLRREREAARQKAANDRAVARRLAKESMELIEDERLELMEIAASRKGLPSIISLDSEALQNLDSYRDMLQIFPPKSVKLMKPFAVKPWLGSEENVGNLLMVWKFLITFADVLGLWPFTLDEFVQAFHDYDSRLLGEIHVLLLRTIIKDIEDVARTPATGVGANQYTVANPGGGHPHVVEGAYAWGFDIRSWQRNVSPLTWPEVLRQFALSAGFGPKLKKRSIEQVYSREETEGNDGMDIVSNLRNGAAVENAVTIMRERGYSNPRRPRHRLTPGTVKFAAFHVLSLEGSDGLNILEVADRIQKSGLRDLTTSKTPEASIAAALSRDTKLFERTAPSTYCLRSPYRKDPADAENILSEAREKIRVFKSGLVDVEADVDGVEADEVEKDEDSESDTAEDPEIDDLANDITVKKDKDTPFGMNRCEPKICLDEGDANLHMSKGDSNSNGNGRACKFSPAHLKSFKDLDDKGCTPEEMMDVGVICRKDAITDHEDTDIDESYTGEPWVQGLMEGEYSVLSVEERLNALVALVGVANEGNSIRIALEERLEAANALKKQMWAESQLDKRRMKEEYVMKTPYTGIAPVKTESTYAPDRSPIFAMDENNNDILNATVHQKPLIHTQNNNNTHPDLNFEKNLALDSVAGSENGALQQSVYAERCRAQLKSYISHKAEEMYVYKSLPLGQDRRRNRYWQFVASASCNDPGAGRIFVELCNDGWRLIDSEEGFDTLLASLDVRGVRESHLHALLLKVEPLFKESVRKKVVECSMDRQNEFSDKVEGSEERFNPDSGAADSPSSTICASNIEMPEPSSSFLVQCGRKNSEMKSVLTRYKYFEDWLWTECFSSSFLFATKYGKKRCSELVGICGSCHNLYFNENYHCPICHKTYTENRFNLSEHAVHCREIKPNLEQTLQLGDCPPPRMRLLKALLALVEVCVPPEALELVWSDSYRHSWGTKLHNSSSVDDILWTLTLLEGGIKRDFLFPSFQTTNEWLGSCHCVGYTAKDASTFGTVTVLPWIPQTTSAVALRLMELDGALAYLPEQKIEAAKDIEARQVLSLPSNYTLPRIQDDEFIGPHGEYQHEDAWLEGGSQHSNLAPIRGGRGRGRGRTRGGRSQRRVGGSRGESSKSLASSDGVGQVIGGWKSRSTRGKGGCKRGRRSARRCQKPVKKVAPAVMGRTLPNPVAFNKSPPGFSGRGEWITEETRGTHESNSERSDYDDNGQASGDEYDDMAVDDYAAVYNNMPSRLMDGSDYNVEREDYDEVGEEECDDMDEDDVDVDEGGEYDQGDMDVGGYLNADSDDDGVNGDEAGGRAEGHDDTSDSASTEYTSDE